jgi:hypothetical protein
MEKEITKRLWYGLWKDQKTKKRKGQRTQGKRNYQMVVVRIRINIGIVLKEITRKKLNGIWNALSAVKLKPAIYAKIPDV